MVKLTLTLPSENHFENSTLLVQTLRKLIEKLEFSSLPKFIILLSELSSRLKPCKKTEQAYSILLICIILQSHLKKLLKIPKNIQLLFSNLLELQVSQKPLHSRSSSFLSTQEILNNSANHLKSLKSSNCPLKAFHLMHFLTIYTNFPFKHNLKTLFKLLTSNHSSIFTYTLNDSIPYLPQQDLPKPTLVLDLDETLCHFTGSQLLLRPGVQDFISSLSAKFELVLFTAAQENYANSVLTIVDPLNKIVHRLYRQHLTRDGSSLVKDLRVLGRDLERVLIIDNDPINFKCQPENGIRIESWTGQTDDRELFRIAGIFMEQWKEGSSLKDFIRGLGVNS